MRRLSSVWFGSLVLPISAERATLDDGAPQLPACWIKQLCLQRRDKERRAERATRSYDRSGGHRPDHKVSARRMDHVRQVHEVLSAAGTRACIAQ